MIERANMKVWLSCFLFLPETNAMGDKVSTKVSTEIAEGAAAVATEQPLGLFKTAISNCYGQEKCVLDVQENAGSVENLEGKCKNLTKETDF